MKRRFGGKKYCIAAAVCAAALMPALLATGIWARYIRSISWKADITFSADLAEEIYLVEHKAEKQTDGSYRLDDTVTVTENAYTVMPGVDIPKDPWVYIGNKSAVDAWLYIEVADGCPEGITYSLTENWIALKGENGEPVTGSHGGAVYVYSADKMNASVLNETFTQHALPILQDDTVFVSQFITNPAGFSLDFYGYMAQTAEGKTAAEVFMESF
ncbi:MAG: hypothetical protein Q4C58_03185 [Eubacteriales bacterium]|nr:hypothetical protein [Eubacteriales bacterium]